jgi:hypothetical protein
MERRVEFVGRSDNTLYVLTTPQPGEPLNDPVRIHEIRLSYPIIKLGNWQVLGQLEAAEAGTLVFSVTSDEEELQALRDRVPHASNCDHCNTLRRRRFTYLLRCTETRAFRLVGKSCLRDFTGIDPAAALFLARLHELVLASEEDLEGFVQAGGRNAVSTETFLARVSFLIAAEGFTSMSGSRTTGRTPTCLDAMRFEELLDDRGPGLSQFWRQDEERHREKARAIRAHYKLDGPEEGTDHFTQNVRVLLAADLLELDRKHLAFAAAAVAQFGREAGKNGPATRPSEHVGVKGQKLTTGVRIKRVIPIEGRFGLTHLVLMDDEQGNRLVWKASACPQLLRESDDKVVHQVRATVKEHDDYKGMAQTVVTRLALQAAP